MDRFRGLFSLYFLKVRTVNFFVWEKSQVVGGGKTLKMLKMQTETTREMYLDVALASAARD